MVKLRNFGIVGAAVAGLLCFTPMLVLLLGMFGVSWLTGYADFVLLPLLVLFVGIAVYAYWQGRGGQET